jgi:hypothetical protein
MTLAGQVTVVSMILTMCLCAVAALAALIAPRT